MTKMSSLANRYYIRGTEDFKTCCKWKILNFLLVRVTMAREMTSL